MAMATSRESRKYQLSDRYADGERTVFMTGIQALARLPIEQLRADRAAGLNTAAFASGYPGSPLSGLDQEFVRAAKAAPGIPFVVQPNVNEELGATAVMGSQLAGEQPDAKYDGVVGIWFGKAPGLDRAGDAIRHGVYAGASQHGGALVIVGDDPAAKSSTVPSSSDLALMDLHLPLFYPGDVQDALDLGRHAIAMSRATGLWTSLKIVAAVADGSGTVDVSPDRLSIVIPDMHVDGAPLIHHPDSRLLPPHNLDIERDIHTVRFERARRYVAANDVNRITVPTPDAWIGIASTGVTYHEVRESLRRLGLTNDHEISAAGIRLVEYRMPLPFDPDLMRRFAAGLDELVVVEEKNPTLELFVKDALYGTSAQPLVVGKYDDCGPLIPNYGAIVADVLAPALRRRLEPRIGDRLTPPPPPQRERSLIPLSVERSPYFCSGCPHNWGTKVPEGVLVGAGIGCHTMTLLMDEERVGPTAGITQMGGEGAQWIGMSPFVDRDHFIQNLGDGTFFHSGQLAIQAAIAAGVNITYKLLYNGTVAMTGGQDPVGQLAVPEIADILITHGVRRVIITTDDTDRYKGIALPRDSAGRIQVWDRTRIVEAQETLAAVDGVTMVIHDQACAAQKRRLRKRNNLPTPTTRVVINHRICEACGDCGAVSNCLSVQAVDTPLGVKTTIDQTTCNLDYSCLGGDCPSFMTVEPNDDPTTTKPTRPAAPAEFPTPVTLVDPTNVSIRIAGIGGTGVVTAAQIIGTAAMLDGFDSRGLDQTGLSQKAGPVVSDLRLSTASIPDSNLLGDRAADVLIAFDLLTAASARNLESCGEDHTIVVGSTTVTPTGSMIGHPDVRLPELSELRRRLDQASMATHTRLADAGRLANAILGSSTSANLFVIGAAVQHGVLPVTGSSLEEAIRLNGVQVDANIEALRWGRAWIVDPAAVEAVAADSPSAEPTVVVEPLPPKLARRVSALPVDDVDTLAMLTADLVAYQHERYAAEFLDVIERVEQTEPSLTMTVARSLHKLMAYKDEYEVARLLIAPDARVAADAVGGPGAKVTWKLHPPMLKALGRTSKIGLTENVGRPLMTALAAGKRLRGTRLDPFGRTQLRRAERALIDEYRSLIDAELVHVRAGGDVDLARSALALPMEIRGYEDLKLRRIREYEDAVAARAEARTTTASS